MTQTTALELIAKAFIYEDRILFGERALKVTPDGWPFFRVVLPLDWQGPRQDDPAHRVVFVLGVRPRASGGFESYLTPLAADGAPRRDATMAINAGADWLAVWQAFIQLRFDVGALRRWLADHPVFHAGIVQVVTAASSPPSMP